MLQEGLTVFQRMREKNDRLILDEYVPKDGTYRLIELTDDGYQTGKHFISVMIKRPARL